MEGENEETESMIEDFCRSFLKEFPGSDQPFQPRTLQHLSRCKVRKCLSLSSNLPHGVRKLGLPKKLQDYVSLKTEMK